MKINLKLSKSISVIEKPYLPQQQLKNHKKHLSVLPQNKKNTLRMIDFFI